MLHAFVYGPVGYIKRHNLQNRIKKLKKEIHVISQQNSRLKKDMIRLKTDPEFFKKKAREYGFVCDNEIVLRFVGSPRVKNEKKKEPPLFYTKLVALHILIIVGTWLFTGKISAWMQRNF